MSSNNNYMQWSFEYSYKHYIRKEVDDIEAYIHGLSPQDIEELDKNIYSTTTFKFINKCEFVIKWTISEPEKAIDLLKESALQSPNFFCTEDQYTKHKLYLSLSLDSSQEYLMLSLLCGDVGCTCHWCLSKLKYYFAVLDSSNNILHRTEYAYKGKENKIEIKFFKKGLLLKKRHLFLEEDQLRIICYIIDNTKGKDSCESFPKEKNCVLEKVHRGMEFSDVKLIIEDKEIKAHKNILAAGSEVFSAMLRTDMIEGNTGVIQIIDAEHGVMKQVINYLYTGNIDDHTPQHIEKLLTAASKYKIDELKIFCEEYLIESMSFENVLNLAILAYLHECEMLKKAACSFLLFHKKDIFDTPDFEKFADSYPHIIKEFFRAMHSGKGTPLKGIS